ncbi:hypothetical protein ACFQX8_08495 [Klenkia terrae]|uniref:hypothetical protein n=1 Tax=Klenkia terrae TaxID=1052259 RepID=UPI00360A36AA
MRAWRVHSLGDPADVMTLDEVPEPEPGPGQVKVKVLAAALNFPDILMAQGTYQEKPRCRSPRAWSCAASCPTAAECSVRRPAGRVRWPSTR